MACDEVSLAVPPGTGYALLGRKGSGKTSLVRCILGERRPTAGRVLVFGEEPRKGRRRIATLRSEEGHGPWRRFWSRLSRAGASPPEDLLSKALLRRPDLLVVDEFPLPDRIADEVSRGLTVFLATADPGQVPAIARRVGFLLAGRLLVDEDLESLHARFRRIRYVNQMTETRLEYGNELDGFDAVRVKARGWGVDAIVSNFTPEAFDRFRQIDGVEEARESKLSLQEIFEAVAGGATRRAEAG